MPVMGNPKKVFLALETGPTPDDFELPPLGYRAVGRLAGADETVQFTTSGGHVLSPEDLARIERHLGRRASEPTAEGGRMRIGNLRRGPDILLADNRISRTHAMFFFDEDGASVVDMFSTNGTLVNGRAVDDADLHDGDIVHIGEQRFVVRIR
jgi:pSer/pThr/pTyr-binding forkhead associated (FHA) protein